MPFKYSLAERDKKYKVVCLGIIEIDNKIVLVQNGTRVFHGKWGFPIGTLSVDEDIFKAIQRGVKEDTNLAVEVDSLIGIYNWYCKELGYGFIYPIFVLKNPQGELRPNHKDVLNVKLFDYHRIFKMPSESLTHSELKKIIKRYRRGEHYPLDIIQEL